MLLLGIGLGYGAAHYLFFSSTFKIEDISITGGKAEASEEIRGEVKQYLDQQSDNIFLISAKAVENTILEHFPSVGEVVFKRKFPRSIEIRVQERPKAAVWCAGTETCFFIDTNGIAFESVKTPAIFTIYAPESSQASLGKSVIDKNLLSFLTTFQATSNAFATFRESKISIVGTTLVSPERAHFHTNEGWEIYASPAIDLQWQTIKLDLVLQKKIPQEKRRSLEYIDLRFGDQAYVKYK